MTEMPGKIIASGPAPRPAPRGRPWETIALAQIEESGVGFAGSDPRMTLRWQAAIEELLACIKPTVDDDIAILNEGGVYYGCWLESTGTINNEILSRFARQVARDTFSGFLDHQRADGCLPYKLTTDGPVFSQIQLVTPPARSIANHSALHGDDALLQRAYEGLSAYDAWLAKYRDTRSTGAVEAFCAFDTGHDLSPRFWHAPDSPHKNQPGLVRPDHPTLPFIAPDLTATVSCGRRYLAQMAEILGHDPAPWVAKAEASEHALFDQCWDETDGTFYDRDKTGAVVRVQSDVLLRVLACEIGDEAFFERAMRDHLLSTRKFFAKYPFTSVAMDDPRFDPHFGYNSWAGPSNFLSLIRAPHAFEHHGRHVELGFAMQPILSALFRADRFPQCVSPFNGQAGFTEKYSPAILCLLDFVERICGILPRPNGTVWATGLVPQEIDHRDVDHETSYARKIDGKRMLLCNSREGCRLTCDGSLSAEFPLGLRLVLSRAGSLQQVIGMSAATVSGEIVTPHGKLPITVGPNEVLEITNGGAKSVAPPRLVTPSH